MSGTAYVLGCRVDLLDRSEIWSRITAAFESSRMLHIVTLNPEQIIAAQKYPEVRALLASGDLITIDGVGLEKALHMQGMTGFDRVTGVSLMNELVSTGARVFLLGGRPGASEMAAANLLRQFPGSNIAGSWSGGVALESDDRQSIERIAACSANTVLVAYGAPAQTAWIERNRSELERIGVRVAVGIGGAIDYAAGLAAAAPTWMSRFGLEWLYRLVREPWRWRRQLVLPRFAILAAVEAFRLRLDRK